MRVGFDVSAASATSRGTRSSPKSPGPRWPPGLVRLATELPRALERRGVIEVVRLAAEPGTNLRRWRSSELPRAVRAKGLVGLHSFTSAFAVRGPGARVQTIHELPWRHGVAENAGLRHRAWAALGPLIADRVLCGTEHVARDLRRRLLPGRDRVVTCPWGVGPPFADEPPPGEVDEVLLGYYRLAEDPLILCLGAVREKKNLAAVLHGVAEVKRRNGPRLVVVVTGGETPALRRDLGLAAKLGLSGVVTTLDSIEEEHLPGLLRLASAVPVLSHSEGFGFPALEALASGTPAIVPRGSAQAEVAGRFGIEVDPASAASVADGLEHAVREREALRYTLSERARELSWDRCAEQVEDLWRELAK
jgi:alpha-1,3-rhamnosyl/mannosyltransferase